MFEDDFPFPKVGQVNFLEGIPWVNFLGKKDKFFGCSPPLQDASHHPPASHPAVKPGVFHLASILKIPKTFPPLETNRKMQVFKPSHKKYKLISYNPKKSQKYEAYGF